MERELARNFQALWNGQDTPPDLEAFLREHPDTSVDDLAKVCLSDQERRWSTGVPLKVEDYLALAPALATQTAIKLQLAVGEFNARGLVPTDDNVEEFSSRFVDIRDDLIDSLIRDDSRVARADQLMDVTRSQDSVQAGQRVGRYRLGRILGEGGFGRVHLAFDEDLQRAVAIKIPKPGRFQCPEDIERYRAEARMVASLDHPSIVPVYDTGVTDGGDVYLVSKFIDGKTLSELLLAGRPNYQETSRIIAVVARALQHAHQRRLVHRDIKPGNILLETETDAAYLADFGLAIREEDYLFDARVVGTPAYMSPEQVRSESHRLAGPSDVFSLGVVLYEMLTGQVPFRAKTVKDLFRQITTVEPIRPCEIDHAVPAELERICLNALAKSTSERYASADLMAEDLEQWGTVSVGDRQCVSLAPEVSSRGLRSFEASDAGFFFRLLPGPRTRDGLPRSLSLWKTKIEEVDPEKTFSVGLIYGPSGCGKSSFVKAGLLPCLTEEVTTVYVEAAPEETELRLLAGLQKQGFPIKEGESIVQVLSRLRRAEHGKTLLVIDQFEQWLHGNYVHKDADLVTALRQCDGKQLQALVLVRDDFAMAVARFMKSLDIPIVQGENFATIDLFDEQHSESVLTELGRASGRLPPPSHPLTAEQKEFVRSVVSGLARAGRVICVQLALYAELIKSRPWTLTTLQQVGGTERLGISFLEETFSSRTANPIHRLHQVAARRVLKLLLPDVGTDIKGKMRSYDELLDFSGYSASPNDFAELLRVLDSELRLITPTDPEGQFVQTSDCIPSRCYQLTHDYLVPSLREWLTNKQRESYAGRAELLLTERTSIWESRPEVRNLPILFEWIRILVFVRGSKWTADQSRMMSKANAHHLTRFTIIFLVFGMIATAAITVRHRAISRQNKTETAQIVKGLLQADTSQVKSVLESLRARREYIGNELESAFANSPIRSNARLHAGLAMAVNGKPVIPFLHESLLTVTPRQFPYVLEMLESEKARLIPQSWEIATDPEADSSRRFRAACILAKYAPEDSHWLDKAFCQFVVDHLVHALPSELPAWRSQLFPVRERLVPALTEVYRDESVSIQVQNFAASTLSEFVSDDPQYLFDLLASAQGQQFELFLKSLEKHREKAVELGAAEIEAYLDLPLPDGKTDSLARGCSNAVAMMVRLGSTSTVWATLRHRPNPSARSLIILGFKESQCDPRLLMKQYRRESDVSAKRAILLALSEFDLPLSEGDETLATIETVYQHTADAGLHSAAECLLRKWGQDETLSRIERKLQSTSSQAAFHKNADRNWFVNKQGLTFAVLDGGVFSMGSPASEVGRAAPERLHRRRIDRRFAISTKELTRQQWAMFLHSTSSDSESVDKSIAPSINHGNLPAMKVTWFEAAHYCNWLSEQEGIPEDQWCYKANEENSYDTGMTTKPDNTRLSGYRLPTEAEWEYSCRAGSVTSRSFGNADSLLIDYAWHAGNRGNGPREVGLLKPNDFGLFDMHGNVYEWCQDAYGEYPDPDGGEVEDIQGFEKVSSTTRRVLRGGAYLIYPVMLRSAYRSTFPPDVRFSYIGFRPARTLRATLVEMQ